MNLPEIDEPVVEKKGKTETDYINEAIAIFDKLGGVSHINHLTTVIKGFNRTGRISRPDIKMVKEFIKKD